VRTRQTSTNRTMTPERMIAAGEDMNAEAAPPARLWTARLIGRFALLSVGVWLYAADTLVLATISPAVVADIGGVSYINWAASLYEVAAIISGAAAPVISARHGTRRLLSFAAATYAVGCLVSAIAPSIGMLIAGRTVQGLGGGMLMTLCYIAMSEWFPLEYWPRLFGIEALIWSAGSLLGPLVGGLFVGHAGWRAAFWFFGAQGLALALLGTFLPADAPGAAGRKSWPRVPLTMLAAATLLIAHSGVARGVVFRICECATGFALLYCAARYDRRSAMRLLPAELLDLRQPISAGLMMILALSLSCTSFWCYGPLILNLLFGTTALHSGYILAGESMAWSLATVMVSRWPVIPEGLMIRLGAMTVAAGAAGFTLAVPAGAMTAIVTCALFEGFGFGLLWPAMAQRLATLCADKAQRSLVAASQTTLQRVGYCIGTATTGIAANLAGLADGVSQGGPDAVAGIRSASFWVFAAFIPTLCWGVSSAFRFASAGEARR